MTTHSRLTKPLSLLCVLLLGCTDGASTKGSTEPPALSEQPDLLAPSERPDGPALSEQSVALTQPPQLDLPDLSSALLPFDASKEPTPPLPDLDAVTLQARQSVALGTAQGHIWSFYKINSYGVDNFDRFTAPADQPLPPFHVLAMLSDLPFAEEVLRAGTITEVKSVEQDHVMFKATMQLAPQHAARLGRTSIRVAFKPAYLGLYGKEWKRELLFYQLGRHLGVQSLVPIVERYVATEPFLASVDAQLVPVQKSKMLYHNPPALRTHMRGTVQLWVEGFKTIFGHRASDNAFITELAQKMKPELQDPMWQALSDMIVLDFLVYNSDRAREGGSIRLPFGGQRLILLDNGDALLPVPPTPQAPPCRQHFAATLAFSPNVYEKLKTLDAATLQALWVDMDGRPLTSDPNIALVLSRAAEVTDRIQTLARGRKGGLPSVLFPQDSAEMLKNVW